MDKVYIVTTTKGYYDEREDIIIGVYSSNELAMDGRTKWKEHIETLKNRYTQEQADELDIEYKQWILDSVGEEDMPEHVEKYWNWRYCIRPHEYGYPSIEVYEVDKITHYPE